MPQNYEDLRLFPIRLFLRTVAKNLTKRQRFLSQTLRYLSEAKLIKVEIYFKIILDNLFRYVKVNLKPSADSRSIVNWFLTAEPTSDSSRNILSISGAKIDNLIKNTLFDHYKKDENSNISSTIKDWSSFKQEFFTLKFYAC